MDNENQLENAASVIEKSYSLIKEAIAHNESTGWLCSAIKKYIVRRSAN